MSLKNIFLNTFSYTPKKEHSFILPQNPNNEEVKQDDTFVYPSIKDNLEYLKIKYNTIINNDVIIRNFTLTINDKNFKAFLIFIDGMVDNDSINTNILKPLLKNKTNIQKANQESILKKFSLDKFIYNKLIPQNNISTENEFKTIIQKINAGFSVLFVDSCENAFCIEAKKLSGRTTGSPQNETVVRGAQEAFVENIRVNTGLIRKIVNNENLVFENFNVRKSYSNCCFYLLSF